MSRNLAGGLGSLVFLGGLLITLGHLFGGMIPVAVTAAMGEMSLGGGLVLAAGPENFPLRLVGGPGPQTRLLWVLVLLVAGTGLAQGLFHAIMTAPFEINRVLVTVTVTLAFVVLTAVLVTLAGRGIAQIGNRAEAQLRQSQANLGEAQRLANLGSWEWQIPGDEVRFSLEGARLFGLEPGAPPQNYDFFLQRLHPDDRPMVEAAVQRILFQGEPYDLEYRIILPDGGQRFIHARGEVFVDAAGRPQRMIGTAQDLTARKYMEGEIRRAKARLEYLLTSSPAVIYSFRPEGDYPVTFVSANITEQLGYEPQTILNTPQFWRERVHPDDLSRVLQEFRGVFQRGHSTGEYRFRHQDGTYRWMHDERRLVRDSSGQPLEVVGYLIDITTRKQAEEALNAQLHFLQQLLDTIPNPIFYKDVHGIYLGCNKAFQAFLGLPQEEIVGRGVQAVAPPELAEIYRQSDLELFAKPGVQVYESRVEQANGAQRQVLFSKATFVDVAGRVTGLVGVIIDLTERKRLEEGAHRAQRLQALGTLAAGMAHEIRNPLAICSSAAQFLRDDNFSPKLRRQLVEKIQAGVQRASAIIDKLMVFAGGPEGRGHTRIDLGGLMEEILAEMASSKRLPGIQVESDWGAAPLIIQGNPALLKEAFHQLYLNAIKAMPQGGRLTTHLKRVNHEALVQITDTGSGIPAAALPHIFDLFYKEDHENVGLGLSLCYTIVQQHQGTIEVDSKAGKGSTFTVRLPLAAEE